jgi:transglutaminase-like putative cysteine protease
VRYHIYHTTTYTYNQAVYLKPHLIRLHPYSNGNQTLNQFEIVLDPKPTGLAPLSDLDGNTILQAWFAEPTESLRIETQAIVFTHLDNPFNYLLEPWAIALPFDYPHSLYRQLQPYLQPYGASLDPAAIALAQQIHQDVKGNTQSFLSQLQQHIYRKFEYIVREEGDPWAAGVTIQRKQGSCRDFAVVFMEACRAMGLAARFVSGYEEGDANVGEWELHGWVEVYLPGGGWRGYDPTHGLAVGDRYIALVASAIPSYTAPVAGHIVPVRPIIETHLPPSSKMETTLAITATG